jgi:hypothetical protein
MASEITVTQNLAYAKGQISQRSLGISGKSFNITGTAYVEGSQLIPTSATAIVLGNLTTLGWFCIKNNDATNPVDILVSTVGSHFLTIQAGECACGRFASTVTAPAAIATGGSVYIEYLILEA